jgi:CheY-like chemotaxis protein
MKILLVEDDDDTREIIITCLKSLNSAFEFEIADNGDDALHLYRDAGPYDLVLTDIGHPGATGNVVIDVIRKSDPTQPVIVETGQALEVTESICRSHRDIPVFEKYRLLELLKTMNALLNAASRKSRRNQKLFRETNSTKSMV